MSIWDGSPQGSKEAFEELKHCAAYMYTITYEELGNKIGLPPIGTNRPLGFIRDSVCRPRGIPWLNALAVNKKNLVPGDSFIPDGAKTEIRDPVNEFLWWRGMVIQVYAFPWDTFEVK